MKQRFTSLLLIFLFFTFAKSQTTFTASTQNTNIAIGEQAVIVATLIANKNLGAVTPPAVNSSDAFTLINSSRQGPSSFSSIEIINGVTKQRNEVHYQFIYQITPKKSGSFVFPALEITIDGSTYKTNPISFNASNQAVKNSDIKIILSLGKHSMFVGEQAPFVFKVAQRSGSSLDVRNGFPGALEKIEKSFGKSFSLVRLFTNQVSTSSERIDGEMYSVYSLPFIVVALNEGSYSIPPVPFEYQELRRAQRQKADPFFDDFFDNDFFGGGVQAVAKSALSNPLSVQVKQLPTPPAGFTGSVGNFIVSSSLEPKEVPAGEAATLKITVKGNTRPGSMGEITLPKLDNCELFTPEKQTSSDTTSKGFSSVKVYKYMLVPKTEGTVTIPSVSLPYFDPSTESYKTASSEPLTLKVTAGKTTSKQPTRYLSQEEIQQIGQDIRYIKTDVTIRNQPSYPYREPLYFLLLPIPFIIFILSLIYKYQSVKMDKNAARYKRQKALASAVKQINLIRKQGAQLSQSVFLGKVASVIEKYISAKFSFAATGQTLEELKEEILKYNADEKVVNDLATFIQHLDGYRFGGLTFDESSRTSTLEKTIAFLENLEKSIKKEKTQMSSIVTTLSMFLVLSVFVFQGFSSPAQPWFDQANKFYSEQNFDSAAVYYQKIVSSGTNNSSVYFNLGNTFYRMKKIGLARLYYEKALRLNPGDQDISANIRYVSANIVDRMPEPERGFIESVLWHLHILLSLKTQLYIILSLLFIISLSLSGALYIHGNARLWLIYISVLLTLGTGIIGISAGIKIYDSEKISYAIVLSSYVDAKNQPEGTTVLFTAHEGTKFLIRKSVDDWSLVSLPNGASGWVKNSDIGKI